ncbi:Hemin import ATP-binding protein HmuV [Poriferisphaera corsica]|uniref:Hemin import ATP-binding protein HmuV n=1 Tax=Poriferisphaera corsica TaxID=2528020 RepID=A0A517YRV2_9BACT|nr:ABC transporter ATP-binding protein [Poriferisphaera corsica]QDU32948.1 Hemin import ATP-binding protein HmuV [Poriferisphaera corsica]
MTDATSISQPDASDVFLDVKNVSFAYPPSPPNPHVLTDISLQLHPGRITALIGPNAAGKSTLVKLMLGQLAPTTGSILLPPLGYNTTVSSLPPIQRAKHICYVPQRPTLSFAYTVRQVVEMGRFALGQSPQAVDWALERCDLHPQANKIFSQLSGGQQQRVTIARALAQSYTDPEIEKTATQPSQNLKIFLLDEPGSNLDLWHIQQMMAVLRQRADAGFAVLVVLHDINLAARHADDVLLLNQGALAAAGPWQTVLNPQILQSVYRVKIQQLAIPHSNRPYFLID